MGVILFSGTSLLFFRLVRALQKISAEGISIPQSQRSASGRAPERRSTFIPMAYVFEDLAVLIEYLGIFEVPKCAINGVHVCLSLIGEMWGRPVWQAKEDYSSCYSTAGNSGVESRIRKLETNGEDVGQRVYRFLAGKARRHLQNHYCEKVVSRIHVTTLAQCQRVSWTHAKVLNE